MTINKNSNSINLAISKSTKMYNDILKTAIPKYDFSSLYISFDQLHSQLKPLYDQCGLIAASMEPVIKQIELFNTNIKPFQDAMIEINKSISKSLEISMSNFNFDYLTSLQTLSSYSEDTIENIDSSLFVETLDDIYDSIETLEYTDSPDIIENCQSSFLNLKNIIKSNKITPEILFAFIGILLTLVTIIQPLLDNSSEIIISQNEEIIKLEKEQLNLSNDLNNNFEEISDSLKTINNTSGDIDITLQNINESLSNFIESIGK